MGPLPCNMRITKADCTNNLECEHYIYKYECITIGTSMKIFESCLWGERGGVQNFLPLMGNRYSSHTVFTTSAQKVNFPFADSSMQWAVYK